MSETAASGYRAVLALPHTKTVLGLGVLTRLASGLIPFAVLISFTQRHGIGAAGLASGALMLAIALPGPARARWCARRGTWAVSAMATASAALFATAATTLAMSTWLVPLIGTAAAGALLPPLAPTLRALWSRLIPDKQQLQGAHALDSTVEELTFIAAPLLGTAALALTDARLTLLTAALLLPLAAAGLHRLQQRLPAVDAETPPAPTTDSATGAAPGSRSLIRSRDGQGIVVPIVTLGLCAGGLNVIIPEASIAFSSLGSSGYAFAAFSLGGLVGGLVYGRRTWTSSLRTRYTQATLALAASALILAALAASPLMILAVFCAGLPLTPLFVLAYLLVDERILPARHTEANAWLSSGYNLGSAAGAALGGQLIAAFGPRVTAITLAAAAALATMISHRLPTADSPETSTAQPNTETALPEA
ncbi:MFS transporter [Streptomyces sp. A2-16]|uniref:MFS transporter n=1 Tax=Streptomyces sp. A2-16 TaxID=2781734 RepID=UPI001BAEB4A9|nr:MFS transporter [Streptomyces sp. A2-16]QUC59151.1 MFS transporter [Streptomyces sp. A2-16]